MPTSSKHTAFARLRVQQRLEETALNAVYAGMTREQFTWVAGIAFDEQHRDFDEETPPRRKEATVAEARPIRIRVVTEVRSDWPFKTSSIPPGDYDAIVHEGGAVTLPLPEGGRIGAKPDEFVYLEEPPPTALWYQRRIWELSREADALRSELAAMAVEVTRAKREALESLVTETGRERALFLARGDMGGAYGVNVARKEIQRALDRLRLPEVVSAPALPWVCLAKRTADWHASVEGRPELWATGRTVYEAVGDLVAHHPECFGVRGVLTGEAPAPKPPEVAPECPMCDEPVTPGTAHVATFEPAEKMCGTVDVMGPCEVVPAGKRVPSLEEVAVSLQADLDAMEAADPKLRALGDELRQVEAYVRLWDAVNVYVVTCGGDPGIDTVSERRMDAVTAVERELRALTARQDDGAAQVPKLRALGERINAMGEALAATAEEAFERGALTMARAAIQGAMNESRTARAELAKRMEVPRSFITKLLTGDHNMTVRTLARALAACGFMLRLEREPAEGALDCLRRRSRRKEPDRG